jgi:hypothetical protein
MARIVGRTGEYGGMLITEDTIILKGLPNGSGMPAVIMAMTAISSLPQKVSMTLTED